VGGGMTSTSTSSQDMYNRRTLVNVLAEFTFTNF
jgi:hypothetical protein